MESSSDVIIQNLVVPSTMLTSGTPNDSINLNLQNQELSAERTVTSGMISENRTSGIVNATTGITSCQNLTKLTHSTPIYEETVHSIEQPNIKVKCDMNISFVIFYEFI